MLIPDWLARRALTHARQPALLAGAVTWTFGELDARVCDAAYQLAALGVHEGDRVALLGRNSPAYVTIVHAVGRLGATLVPLNVRLAPPELAWLLGDARATLVLYDAEYAAAAQAATRDLPWTQPVALGPERLGSSVTEAVPLREQIALDAVHTIVYTSGTTGRPKGVLLTYGNHWWSAIGSALHLGHHRDDRWLAPLPLFHVGGLAILLRSAIYGIPVVLHDAFDPARVNRALDEDGVTLVSVVATMLQRMLDARGDQPYPRTLRCVLLGGGPAPRPLLEACAARGVPVAQSYGLTEAASQVATLLPEDALRKLGSAGLPLPPTELRIERDGQPVPLGEPGEIVVRGPTVTPGYSDRPDDTARLLRDGWLHTGDFGQLDTDGYLYVLDRRDDLIVSGGENIYPAEVEAVLLAHPAIADAAVIAMPDRHWGQTPLAIVQPHPNARIDEVELLAFCAARLARYKVPHTVRWAAALPRNAAGKLLRRELRE